MEMILLLKMDKGKINKLTYFKPKSVNKSLLYLINQDLLILNPLSKMEENLHSKKLNLTKFSMILLHLIILKMIKHMKKSTFILLNLFFNKHSNHTQMPPKNLKSSISNQEPILLISLTKEKILQVHNKQGR